MKKVRISQVDAMFVNRMYPIEFLFYLKKGLDTQKFRNALKKLTTVFWPVFGEYKNGVISFERYVEDEFYDEEVIDQDFVIPEKDTERFELYSRYSPPDPKRLFVLKVTRFRNGMILVPKMNHLAGDGYSYFFFLSSLAALSQHALLPSKSSLMGLFFKPHHRRTIMKNFFFKGIERPNAHQETRPKMGMEKVSRKDVNALIREVAESKNFRISTNDVLSAMAAKKLIGDREKRESESVELSIPIDVRRKVKEYGRRFFGNALMLHTLSLKKTDIENLPAEELAVQIRASMPSVSKQSYIDYLYTLENRISEGKTEKLRPFDPESGYLVTNISRLPINRLDFGTGIPDLIFPLTIEKNAAAVLAKDENFVIRYAR
jgi:NRPS condensation-like uncharacterized protein